MVFIKQLFLVFFCFIWLTWITVETLPPNGSFYILVRYRGLYGLYSTRILKAHSHSKSGGSIWASRSWVSVLFLNSWRVSVVPYYVTTHLPAIQKQHWHSGEAQIEAQIEPPLFECEWTFRIQALVFTCNLIDHAIWTFLFNRDIHNYNSRIIRTN
jgi:hypothetical protein